MSYVDSFYYRLAQPQKQRRLSKQRLRLLTLLATENITLNEAAEKMHISISTANQHTAAIRHFFEANTTYYAIYQAIAQGYIKVGCHHDNSTSRTGS